jgi:hypothetical protein
VGQSGGWSLVADERERERARERESDEWTWHKKRKFEIGNFKSVLSLIWPKGSFPELKIF